ncbi:hypothetical protein G6F56_003729 [Rhizopus delemar]|nr:hypothetical protein G6F56_003729 [Rhizopus delemar]
MALTLNSVSNDNATLVPASLRSEMTCYPILNKRFLYMVSVSQVDLAPFFLRTFPSTASAALDFPEFTPVSHTYVDVTPFVDSLFALPSSGI